MSLAITFLMPISWLLNIPFLNQVRSDLAWFFLRFDYKYRNPPPLSLSLNYLFTGARACGVTSDTLSQSSILLIWYVTKKTLTSFISTVKFIHGYGRNNNQPTHQDMGSSDLSIPYLRSFIFVFVFSTREHVYVHYMQCHGTKDRDTPNSKNSFVIEINFFLHLPPNPFRFSELLYSELDRVQNLTDFETFSGPKP